MAGKRKPPPRNDDAAAAYIIAAKDAIDSWRDMPPAQAAEALDDIIDHACTVLAEIRGAK